MIQWQPPQFQNRLWHFRIIVLVVVFILKEGCFELDIFLLFENVCMIFKLQNR
jgi:hypothetical protein